MRCVHLLAVTLTLGSASANAATPSADQQHLVYAITRDGSPIGQQILDITTASAVTSIKATSDIDVKVLFVSAYTFHYSGNEKWAGDQLESFDSQTNDNGKQHNVSVRLTGDKLQVEADGHNRTVPKAVGLDNFWSPKLLSKKTVLDTSDGHEINFVAQDLGMETVSYQGAMRSARHYKLTGDIDDDLWFDAETLMRLQFKTKEDGSLISFDLQ